MPILETRKLTKLFGGLRALDSLEMRCEGGEILGVIGPNGAGKTTLFNVISGVYQATSGQVLFNGTLLSGLRTHQVARLGIGRTFQILRVLRDLTVLENILVGCGANFYKHVPSSFGTYMKDEHSKKAMQLLDYVGLGRYKDLPAGNVPIGVQRRLEIGRALALDPLLLLLDEPFSGLSVEESDDQMKLVREIREDGKTIVLVEHNMRVAMELCERLIVLDHGVKISDGAPRDIKRDQKVIAAYLGQE